MNEKTTAHSDIYERNDAGAYVKVRTDSYTFKALNNRIFVEHDGAVKSMKVVDDPIRIYKLQKTQIKAIRGAEGLYSFMKREVESDGSMSCYVKIICNWIMEHGK